MWATCWLWQGSRSMPWNPSNLDKTLLLTITGYHRRRRNRMTSSRNNDTFLHFSSLLWKVTGSMVLKFCMCLSWKVRGLEMKHMILPGHYQICCDYPTAGRPSNSQSTWCRGKYVMPSVLNLKTYWRIYFALTESLD